MNDKPEIVKILKEEEKLGKLQITSQGIYEDLQIVEKQTEKSDNNVNFSDDAINRIEDTFELEDIEETYKTIFDNYAVAVTLADKNEQIISWNKYAEELLNLNEKELFKRSVKSLYPPEEWKRIRAENVRQKGIKYQMETKMIRKNIGTFDVEISLCILRGVEGKTVGSVGIIKDITKLKQTERKLKESEKKYRTIFENSAVAITLTDEKERIISWNKYAEDLLGMDKNELRLKPVKTLYPQDEWKKIREKNIRKKGMQHHLETRILRKNNETIEVDISLSVIKDHDGKIIGSIGVIRDITERKEFEKRLTSIMKYAGDSIYLIDKDFRYLMVNNELLKRFNLSKDQILGKNINELHSPDIAKEFIEKIKMVFENGKPIKDEHTREDKKWFLRTLSPVKDYITGKITAVLVISKDITELKKTEEVLFENEKKYRTIFELSPEAIVLLDNKGNVIDTNGRICDWLQYKKEEIIGQNILNQPFFTDSSKLMIKEKFVKRMMGESIPPYELEFKSKNGTKKIGMVQATPLKDEKGSIIADLAVISDITERKKMEEEMRIKDSAIASSINAIGIIDLNGNISYVNNSFLKLWGYKKENEVLGKNIVQFLYSKGKYDEIMKVLIDKGGWFGELTGVKKNGDKFQIQLSTNMIKDDLHKPICIMTSFVDITDHKKAIKALSESKEKFRVVLENSHDMIYQLNLKTKTYDYVSPSSLKITGYTSDEIIKFGVEKMDALIHPDDKKNIKNHFNKLINNKENKDVIQAGEYRINHKKLGYRWISDTRSLILDDGEAVAIVGNAKDITEQKKVWNEMVKSEEKYRVLAETSADGVFTTDVMGRLTYINPSLEKMIGRRKSKILATPFKDYLSESSVYSFQQIILDIRKKDQKMENIELGIMHGEGFEIPVEVNIAPLKKESGFVGIECTVRDISEREKVVRELKKSENLRTEFMNIAAHELKSPVTPIKGYLELIESDKDVDEKIRNWSRIALRNAERLLLLVNDILDVSRLDTDTMRFNMEKIEIIKILKDAAEDIKPAMENKNLKFVTEIPNNLPMIFADKYRLSQVLKNLLGNAIKFTDYGSITLKAKQENKHILISVEDTGIGISNGELKKIFTKLYQAYTGEDRKNEGAGLGLYICKEIIKKHNGDIWATSEIGKGCVFTIKLPI